MGIPLYDKDPTNPGLDPEAEESGDWVGVTVLSAGLADLWAESTQGGLVLGLGAWFSMDTVGLITWRHAGLVLVDWCGDRYDDWVVLA